MSSTKNEFSIASETQFFFFSFLFRVSGKQGLLIQVYDPNPGKLKQEEDTSMRPVYATGEDLSSKIRQRL